MNHIDGAFPIQLLLLIYLVPYLALCVPCVSDFCLWGSPKINSSVGDVEAETVAWCSKPGHGTRVMPAGTITGIQVLKAPAYILFAGTINQVNVDLAANDYGGEMDPHGADEVR